LATYPATAIVLRRTKLGESDLILTMLSSEGTIIRAVAKGCRKPKSKFAGASEFLRVSDYLLHRGRNLDIVTEARSEQSFPEVTSSYRATLALSAFAEYLLKTHPDGHADPRTFQLLIRACEVVGSALEMGADDQVVDVVVTSAAAKLLAMQGVRIVTSGCCLCGGSVTSGEHLSAGQLASDQMTEMGSAEHRDVGWSLTEGGVLCPECRRGYQSYESTPPAACGWIETLMSSTLAEVAENTIPSAAAADVFSVVFGIAEEHAGVPLRALQMYRAERSATR